MLGVFASSAARYCRPVIAQRAVPALNDDDLAEIARLRMLVRAMMTDRCVFRSNVIADSGGR
jgi:hypothetical protein